MPGWPAAFTASGAVSQCATDPDANLLRSGPGNIFVERIRTMLYKRAPGIDQSMSWDTRIFLFISLVLVVSLQASIVAAGKSAETAQIDRTWI